MCDCHKQMEMFHMYQRMDKLFTLKFQENLQEITLNKEKWLEIAAQLEYKQIKDYVIHRKNK